MKLLCYLLLPILFFLTSCQKFNDLEDVNFSNNDAEYAIPLGSARFSLEDLLENLEDGTFLFVDPDGTIRLNYKGKLATQTSLDVFSAVQSTLTAIPEFPVFDTLIALPFGAPDSVDIDYMDISKGQLAMRINYPRQDILSLEYEFTNAIKDGQTLKGKLTVLPFFTIGDTIDLTGYRIVPQNDSVYFKYKATSLSTNQEVQIPVPFYMMSIKNLEFSYAEGYFGQIVHEGDPDTIEIEFFDNWTRGDVYFEEPTITIYTRNSFGIPTQALIHYFNVRTVNQGILELESPYIDNPPYFAFPRLPDEVGQIKEDTFIFDFRNSNIAQILGAGPEAVFYDVDALTNPERDQNLRGFITDKSAYEVIVEVDLPLYGKSSGFAVMDTLDWDFSGYDEVTYAEFKIASDNELGLEIGVQGYFIDKSGTVLDSLFEERQSIVEAAPVDDFGNPTSVKSSVQKSYFSADRFAKIKEAKKIILSAAFFTTNKGSKSVKVRKDQEVEIRMGLKFGT